MSSPLDTGASRRAFLGLAAGGAALAASGGAGQAQRLASQARIVVLGAGAGGTAIANRLAARLDGASITLVDGRVQHWYQPAFTMIAAGLKPASAAISRTGDWLAEGIDWVAEPAIAIDPEAQDVTTTGGRVLGYDVLVVATGALLDWGAIEGFSLDLVGHDGVSAHYAGPEYAELSWRELDRFTDHGGTGLFGRPPGAFKAPGAPLKQVLLAEDIARRKGTRDAVELVYHTPEAELYELPLLHHRLRQMLDDRGIARHPGHVLRAIEPRHQIATYATEGGEIAVEYDFIDVVPPHRAPEMLREAGLGQGPQGWLDVDPGTLRHNRYANVYGIGDVLGVPKGKTAGSVKAHLPVVEAQILAALSGQETDARFNGYTATPLTTRIGRAMLVEYDYNDNLTPSFPGVIAPLEELWISWLMLEIALKPTYNAMLRGLA